jgi:hypothetical protein
MFAVSLALLASAFGGKDRGVAFGVWGAVTGLAVAVGPLIGGVLTSGLSLRHGVARNRRISVEDSQMRHGRKSRSVLFDGYKRHVLRDLDSGLVPAVGITPANVPEAAVTDDQLTA